MSEKKRALRVGDRCRTYSVYGMRSGTVKRVEDDGCLLLEYDKKSKEISAADSGTFHPKQCRRLIRKPKAERREWWITVRRSDGAAGAVYGRATNAYGLVGSSDWEVVHVREVVRGRK